MLAIFIAGLGPRFDELRNVCLADPCLALALQAPDAEVLVANGFSMDHYSLFHVALETILVTVNIFLAALILWRRADDRMGLLFAFMFVIFFLSFMVEADAALYRRYPALLPLNFVFLALSGSLFLVVFYVFPTGHFVPSWTRWILLIVFAVAVMDPFLAGLGPRPGSDQYSFVLLLALIAGLLVGVYAQVYRYRRVSTPLERQQTKWVILGLVGVVVGILVYAIFIDLFPLAPGASLIFNTWVFAGLAVLLIFFPLSVLISILRYRLWDIDLIIRRTLTYALVTGLLLVVFFGTIVLLQQVFARITGSDQNELVTVLSTLVIAALFVPLRSRVQSAIDRRFYRKKYDAQAVLTEFATVVRDETDLDRLTGRLLFVVNETMQPRSASLWLKPAKGQRREPGLRGQEP
jgi:hypothetical protein